MMKIFDAHIHLADNEYSQYIQHILHSMRALKITACSVSTSVETSLSNLRLFNNSTRDVIVRFVGIHPEFALSDDLEKFHDIFNEHLTLIDGIGEIGLDRSYIECKGISLQKQMEVFRSMLNLAEKTKKPLSIHSRRALDDVLEILNNYNLGSVLLHWFSGSKKQLNKAMDMGLFVSYGPSILFAPDKKTLLKNTLSDKFLVETDGPVRYPRCFEYRPAMSSSFLISVVNSVANVIGLSYHETVRLLQTNSELYLKRKL
jgi:TatD DNase family protein